MNTFYTNKVNSNTAKLLGVEKAVADGNLTLAASNNSSILTENSLEDSYRLFYEALIHFEDNSFTETDSLTLVNLAMGCPTLQGTAVIQAATLYNAVYQLAEVFEYICPEYLDKSMQDPSVVEESVPSISYMISPIPNNGEFKLHGRVDKGYRIQLFSFEGKDVFQQILNEESTQTVINVDLSPGTYTLILKNAEGSETFRKKVVIIK